uniref:Uncharacterized protein n=1 Tax=Knipowitschia caucasica TaxID=637954 RepID=A0AAV2LWX4_KNICA
MVSHLSVVTTGVIEEAMRRKRLQRSQGQEELPALSPAGDRQGQEELPALSPAGDRQGQEERPALSPAGNRDTAAAATLPSTRAPCAQCQRLKEELAITKKFLACQMENKKLKNMNSAEIQKDSLMQSSKHSWFIQNSPALITKALDQLKSDPKSTWSLLRFFSLLGGYLIATTGHRKGVLVNMLVTELQEAVKVSRGRRVIRVKQHKTQRYFGEASIPLRADEYRWLHTYIGIRGEVEVGSACTFFHISSGQPLLKLPTYFKNQWERFGLGPAPNFNMLRSSVATYSKRQHGRKCYERVATFMCHDPITAKRFYQASDPAEEAFNSRTLTIMAVSSYAGNHTSTESSDDWKPPKRKIRHPLPEEEEEQLRQGLSPEEEGLRQGLSPEEEEEEEEGLRQGLSPEDEEEEGLRQGLMPFMGKRGRDLRRKRDIIRRLSKDSDSVWRLRGGLGPEAEEGTGSGG